MLFLAVGRCSTFHIALVGNEVISSKSFPRDGTYQILAKIKENIHYIGTVTVSNFTCSPICLGINSANRMRENIWQTVEGLYRESEQEKVSIEALIVWLEHEVLSMLEELLIAPRSIRTQFGYKYREDLLEDIDEIETLITRWRAELS